LERTVLRVVVNNRSLVTDGAIICETRTNICVWV